MPANPIGLSKLYGIKSGVKPSTTDFGFFANNKGHSNGFSNFAIDEGIEDNEAKKYPIGTIPYTPNSAYKLSGLTSYMCKTRGIWLKPSTSFKLTVENVISADHRGVNFIASWGTSVNNALMVGKSANPDAINSALGIHLYDGPVNYNNIHFENFVQETFRLFGAAAKHKSRVRNISFKNSPKRTQMALQPIYGDCNYCSIPEFYDSILEDMDGSVTGITNSILIPQMTYNNSIKNINGDKIHIYPPSCKSRPDFGAWQCTDVKYALMEMATNPPFAPPIYVKRSDGIEAMLEKGVLRAGFQFAMITNKELTYTFDVSTLVPKTDYFSFFFKEFDDKTTRVKVVFTGLRRDSMGIVKSIPATLTSVSSLSALDSVTRTSFYKNPTTFDITFVLLADVDTGSTVSFDAFDGNKPWLNYRSYTVEVKY